uniref:Uncharacterized protein n=1 Tax=Romanomermis culicivorax TaxID=13658 RepID=A0A915IAR6_ROMCU
MVNAWTGSRIEEHARFVQAKCVSNEIVVDNHEMRNVIKTCLKNIFHRQGLTMCYTMKIGQMIKAIT